MDMRLKRLLVIRLSSMGDVVLTTPVVRLLSKAGAIVDVLSKAPYVGIWEGNPYVENVLAYETTDASVVSEQKYDYIVDLQNNLRSRKLTLNVKSSVIRIRKHSIDKWLYLKLGINRLSKLHVADQHIQALTELGLTDDGVGLDIIQQEVQLSSSFDEMKKVVVVAMGGSYLTKRIPTSLVNSFISENDTCDYVLVGGSDADQTGLIKRENTHNLISRTTLRESIAILSKANLVITGDTGMMHIAAALQKPIIVVWGSTSEDFGFYPYYGSKSEQTYTSVSITDLSCRPCSKYGRDTCPKGHMNCLNHLNGQMVRKEIEQFISI